MCCRRAVETSEKEQVQFQEWVLGSKEFSNTEKAAFKVDSVPAFQKYWEETNSARERFDRNHERGCGLWARRYQSSAAFIQPFMDDFSPIIKVVKDLGAPYGAVAVGTISLLFAVSDNSNMPKHWFPLADTRSRWHRIKMKLRKA